MARIILTDSLSKRFTDGNSDFDIVAPSVRSLIRELDNRYPGLGTQISDGTLSVAIDGDIYQEGGFFNSCHPNLIAYLYKEHWRKFNTRKPIAHDILQAENKRFADVP